MTHFYLFHCLYIFTNQSFNSFVNIHQYHNRTIYTRCHGVCLVVYTQVFIPWGAVVYA